MRKFFLGLAIGLASMYWYAYHSEVFLGHAKAWLADASHDPDATTKVDQIFNRTR